MALPDRGTVYLFFSRACPLRLLSFCKEASKTLTYVLTLCRLMGYTVLLSSELKKQGRQASTQLVVQQLLKVCNDERQCSTFLLASQNIPIDTRQICTLSNMYIFSIPVTWFLAMVSVLMSCMTCLCCVMRVRTKRLVHHQRVAMLSIQNDEDAPIVLAMEVPPPYFAHTGSKPQKPPSY